MFRITETTNTNTANCEAELGFTKEDNVINSNDALPTESTTGSQPLIRKDKHNDVGPAITENNFVASNKRKTIPPSGDLMLNSTCIASEENGHNNKIHGAQTNRLMLEIACVIRSASLISLRLYASTICGTADTERIPTGKVTSAAI